MSMGIIESGEYNKVAGSGVPVVVDKVESGNLNPVTSNAVAEKLKVQDTTVVTLTPSAGVTVNSAYYTKSGNVVQFGVEFTSTQELLNISNIFGADAFTGATGKFPRAKFERNVAAITSWELAAEDATGYFYFNSTCTYTSVKANVTYIVNGTYICVE